jgi:hypothetical protein
VRAREYLTNAEVDRLIQTAGANRNGYRDSTMVLVAYRQACVPSIGDLALGRRRLRPWPNACKPSRERLAISSPTERRRAAGAAPALARSLPQKKSPKSNASGTPTWPRLNLLPPEHVLSGLRDWGRVVLMSDYLGKADRAVVAQAWRNCATPNLNCLPCWVEQVTPPPRKSSWTKSL